MEIGDLLNSMLGRKDPRQQLADALSGNMQAPAAPQGPQGAPPDQGGVGSDANANPQSAQQAQAPPQPQAYQSPPDIGRILFQLQDRQQSNEMINRGFGLLLGGFAQPQDRAGMVSAMSGMSGPDASTQVTGLANLQQTMMQRQMQMQLLKNIPEIAARLHIDPQTALALYASGKLGDLISKSSEEGLPSVAAGTAEKEGAAAASQASAAATQAGIPLIVPKTTAEIQKAQADAASANATAALTTAKVPLAGPEAQANVFKAQQEGLTAQARLPLVAPQEKADIAQTQANTAALTAKQPYVGPEAAANMTIAQATAQKAQQDAAARARLAENIPAISKATGVAAEVLQSLPPEQLATLATQAQTPTAEQKDYRAAMAQLPTGVAQPTFDEWTAQRAGQKEAATQTNMLQTEQKMSAQAVLPDTMLKVEEQLKIADEIIASKSLENLTGYGGSGIGKILNGLPGTAGRALQAKIDQLAGASGVSAVESLKGVGRILGTEYEAGTEAQSRLHDQTMSATDYRDAIQDYANKLRAQVAIVYQKSGQQIPAAYAPFLPGAKKLTDEELMQKYRK